MTHILDTLRTPGAMLVALTLALAAQLGHTAQVFSMAVGASGWGADLHAYAFAAAVEVAVLLFVLAGHKRISYGFALATFATNLSYYAMHDVPLLSVAGAPAWLMSLLLPACIIGYSHTIAETPQRTPGHGPATPQKPASQPQKGAVMITDTIITRNEAPRPATPPSEAAGVPPQPLTPAQRRAHIREQELSDPAQVAAQFGVSLRTAQTDIAAARKATTHANGKAVRA